jgi:flavin-dependent dehydrogenase
VSTYDAIVVGARCAGSPTAMLLARRGYRVLLVDRATFPSDTLSCHFLHQPGVACLRRWGLLPEVAQSGCPPIRSQTLDVGPFVLRGAPAPAGDVADAYAIRRTVLDKILLDAAADAGAEVRERFSVDTLITDDGRVTGIRGRQTGGSAVTERATIVIGADGRNSLVARSVGASTYNEHPSATCAYYSYWSDVEIDAAELYARPGQMIVAAPTNDGQVFVIVYWPNADFHRVRFDIERSFMTALELSPALAERVRAGSRTERFRGTGSLPNYYRRPHGDGWALVGDAGYHKDPITALGMTDAFRDAELLTNAVHAGLSASTPLGRALVGYERRRNEATAEAYQTTIQFAQLAPSPPEMEPLFAALQDNQEQTGRFFGTVTGTVSAAEFFAPENIARIVGDVRRDRSDALTVG